MYALVCMCVCKTPDLAGMCYVHVCKLVGGQSCKCHPMSFGEKGVVVEGEGG